MSDVIWVQSLHKPYLKPHGYQDKLLLCLSDWIPFQKSVPLPLFSGIWLCKTGSPAPRHLDRQMAGQACWGLFFFSCWRMLSAWIRLACSNWASPVLRPGLLFSMETCSTLALWLAHTATRQTLCLTIQIIMGLWQDESRERVMAEGLFPADSAL